ncbi:sphingoid long-chain base transporter RSB1 [Schizosaccharomyces japonicus yFS275]|uniref:Sphingoid long-chain base transporter RSB1 n=1 Tax=Schizosaccharomyces japonicus (strain yFS275 / FY16936) TaxID=402676 RepID=B6JW20_SCHJY|nr:sphingoid long-chain base transporter RSB1 [Schizosaccharomyces japonicus yFS275]EEB05571.1 sphingoid long-chain base transporter RSB1 [Schizosaccharomyces japonicus yFS275]
MQLEVNPYGYIPTEWLGILGIILFSLALIAEIVQIVMIRDLLPLVPLIGTVGEIVGWIGRLYSHSHVFSNNSFLTNFIALCIAPVFYTAQIYTTLQYLVRIYGPDFSWLSPKLYTIVFVGSDIISLIVQAIGGAIAGSADQGSSTMKLGGNITLAGICFQLLSVMCFFIFGLDFASRYRKHKPYRTTVVAGSPEASDLNPEPSKSRKVGYQTLFISTVLVLIRSIYRVIELGDGWDGYVISHEVYFAVFDFIPMFITALLLLGTVGPMLEVRRGAKRGDDSLVNANDTQFTYVSSVNSKELSRNPSSNPMAPTIDEEKQV